MILRCLWSIAALSLVLACDGGEKPAKRTDADKEAAKKDEGNKQAEGEKKAAEGEQADAKTSDETKAGADEKHFDISQDKSGILARSAAVIETDEKIDGEDLRELSHHAENLTNVEDVCRHDAEIRGKGDDIKECVKLHEHEIVQIGPEIYAQLANCLMDANTVEQLDACETAEKEAEKLLHDKPHGEGLDQPTCDEFFTHFEKLAMEDAPEQAELVKEILEEVKADVVSACIDQGSKAEIDCAMKAKTMHELKECASTLL